MSQITHSGFCATSLENRRIPELSELQGFLLAEVSVEPTVFQSIGHLPNTHNSAQLVNHVHVKWAKILALSFLYVYGQISDAKIDDA